MTRAEELERIKIINKAPRYENADFWCDHCKLDQYQRGTKKENTTFLTAVYEAKCIKCGQILQRHITDKQRDPFFRKSQLVREQKRQFSADLLQPGETGFRARYGKTEAEQAREKKEEADLRKAWQETSKSFLAV